MFSSILHCICSASSLSHFIISLFSKPLRIRNAYREFSSLSHDDTAVLCSSFDTSQICMVVFRSGTVAFLPDSIDVSAPPILDRSLLSKAEEKVFFNVASATCTGMRLIVSMVASHMLLVADIDLSDSKLPKIRHVVRVDPWLDQVSATLQENMGHREEI